MLLLGQVDWSAVFLPTAPPLEVIVRGTVVYLALFLLLRVVLREAGSVGVTDLLVVVLIADAAQNAMASDYKSVPDGLLLVVTIVFWSYALEWLGYHIPMIGRFLHPPPLPLILDGKVVRRNLQKELITMQELHSQLREQGVEDIADVWRAYMEGDGRITVVSRDEHKAQPKRRTP